LVLHRFDWTFFPLLGSSIAVVLSFVEHRTVFKWAGVLFGAISVVGLGGLWWAVARHQRWVVDGFSEQWRSVYDGMRMLIGDDARLEFLKKNVPTVRADVPQLRTDEAALFVALLSSEDHRNACVRIVRSATELPA
jgi:hypothetical protein